FLRPRNTIGQEKGRPQGEYLRRSCELNPAHHHLLFPRAIAVVKGIAVRHALRKQFRVLAPHLAQISAILHDILYTRLILGFTDKRHADRLAATGWLRLLFLCVVHHSTVWQILARPSLLLFSLGA